MGTRKFKGDRIKNRISFRPVNCKFQSIHIFLNFGKVTQELRQKEARDEMRIEPESNNVVQASFERQVVLKINIILI